MYKDILKIIGEFSGNDLENYLYNCDSCNKLFHESQMCCIIYYDDIVSNKSYNDYIDFYKKNRIFHYDYICSNCYKNNYIYENLVFFCTMLLDLSSFEDIYYDIIKYKQQYYLHNCIIENMSIEENINGGWYKTLFINYNFLDNVIVEDCLLYQNTEPINKYFENIRNNELFHSFNIDKYLELLN